LKTKLSILLTLFLVSFNSISQNNLIKKSYPLNIPLIISGTFGELRSNHFHGGLDIKTNRKEGYQVKSIYKGFIDRINVSTDGYGKTIYVKHPNGLTSVYAHLSKFTSKIQRFVKSKQYKKQTFEIQLFPKDNEIKVKSGEIIGFSGNTGTSFAPHLHFELRNSKTQNTINPMSFLDKIKDDRRPSIRSLYIFNKILDKNPELITKYGIKKINDSIYKTENIPTSGKISFGLNMFDRQSLSYNKNGIYKVSIYLNDSLKFEYSFDELDFEDSKFINLLTHYKTKKQEGKTIHRIIKHPESKKSFLINKKNNGYFNIKANTKYNFIIKVSDYKGNNSFLKINLIGKNIKKKFLTNENKLIKTDIDYLFEFEDKEILFKKNTFYENIHIDIKEKNDTLYIDKDIHAIKNPFEISFKTRNNDSSKRRQSFISKLNSKGKSVFIKTQKKDDKILIKSNSLGVFFKSRDSISPKIKPINFYKGQWVSKLKYLKLRLEDDYSGVKSYKGFLNNKWILLEYEPKNKTLTYNFSDINFKNTKHNLKIYIEDNVGNKKIYKTMFYRKY